MNEELIRQCAREVVPFVDEPGTGEQNYRYAAAVMAIETYHARHVAPLVEALEGFVSDLTGGGKNGEKWLSISHDALVARIQQARAALAAFGDTPAQKPTIAPEVQPLVEAAQEARRIAMDQCAKARAPECGQFAEIAQDLDAALAPFQQERSDDQL